MHTISMFFLDGRFFGGIIHTVMIGKIRFVVFCLMTLLATGVGQLAFAATCPMVNMDRQSFPVAVSAVETSCHSEKTVSADCLSVSEDHMGHDAGIKNIKTPCVMDLCASIQVSVLVEHADFLIISNASDKIMTVGDLAPFPLLSGGLFRPPRAIFVL